MIVIDIYITSEASVVAILFDLDGTLVQHDCDADGNPVPIAGIQTFLDMCDNNNNTEKYINISKAVVTNAPRTAALQTLDALNLKNMFHGNVVIGEECTKPKPAPEPYLEALKVTGGTPERMVVFEDSRSGIASAKAAGLFTIGIISYDNEEVLLECGADVCIEDYNVPKLRNIIAKQLNL